MLKQPEKGSRYVNELFYEAEARKIHKINEVLGDIKLTKSEEQSLLWIAGCEESTVDNLLSIIEKLPRHGQKKKGGNAHKIKKLFKKNSNRELL